MKCIRHLGALVLAMAVVPAAWAAGNKALSQAQQQYQRERAICLSGQSNQDRATCLREAGAAYQEARRGSLNGSAGADLSQNATQRCNAQPPQDREACIQRIVGGGSASGSVAGGGVLREAETPVK